MIAIEGGGCMEGTKYRSSTAQSQLQMMYPYKIATLVSRIFCLDFCTMSRPSLFISVYKTDAMISRLYSMKRKLVSKNLMIKQHVFLFVKEILKILHICKNEYLAKHH